MLRTEFYSKFQLETPNFFNDREQVKGSAVPSRQIQLCHNLFQDCVKTFDVTEAFAGHVSTLLHVQQS
jgi:hypothetical protein